MKKIILLVILICLVLWLTGCKTVGEAKSFQVKHVWQGVTCVFENSQKQERCFMARYTKYGCTGIGRCSFEVKDNNILSGAHTGMDSTCGGGPGVILDETADTVVFKCPVAVPLATAKVLSECEQLQKTNVDYKAGIAATKQEINNLQTQIASVR